MTGDQSEALYHLGYEWWMFRNLHELLRHLPNDTDPVRNAMIESLAMHGRDLIDFFYDGSRLMGDDYSLETFGLARAAATDPVLTEWRTHTNKRVAHVTSVRTQQRYNWPTEELLKVLVARIQDFRNAIGGSFPSNWGGDMPESASAHLVIRPNAVPQSRTVGTGTDVGTAMREIHNVVRFTVDLGNDKPTRY
jgi:hypothetical protein